jgi:hypothetical protein
LRWLGNAHFAALQATFGDALIQQKRWLGANCQPPPAPTRRGSPCAAKSYTSFSGIIQKLRVAMRESWMRCKKRFQFEAITANTKRLFRCDAVSRNERHFVMSCRYAALQRPGFSSCVSRVIFPCGDRGRN